MKSAKKNIKMTVVQGSILEAEVESIVNAANSLGIMGGGVAGVIKRAAGVAVEEEARALAPIPVGKAAVTSGGATRFAHIIHAPTMPQPGMAIPVSNVALATRAALQAADDQGLTSLAIPGMGTGVGGVAPGEAALAMVKEVRAFAPRTMRQVVLVDVDAAMVAAWREALKAEV